MSAQLTPSDKAAIEDVLTRWNATNDSDDDTSDEEHEIAVDMAELLWQLHGSLPVSG
ncbi:hypothetical protein [Streptomyces similanensis]|uniref:Uncharacterized protein n=1 Tax=Streptomyces similanensis TaxID=1274988 RepID=A0ABP9L549_9ACTN